MNRVHPLIRIGGPILGVIVLIYVINYAVDTFRADQKSARDAERESKHWQASRSPPGNRKLKKLRPLKAPAQAEDAQEGGPHPRTFSSASRPAMQLCLPPSL